MKTIKHGLLCNFKNYKDDLDTVIRYLAAKSNYFGVGGGTGLFEDFTNKKGQFSCKICKTIEAGN